VLALRFELEILLERGDGSVEVSSALLDRGDVQEDRRPLGELVRFLEGFQRVLVVALLEVRGARIEMAPRQFVRRRRLGRRPDRNEQQRPDEARGLHA
jgi:hypothetical protein